MLLEESKPETEFSKLHTAKIYTNIIDVYSLKMTRRVSKHVGVEVLVF